MQKIKKGFSIEYHLINDVLMEWNPIGVLGEVLMDEYITYIPRLVKVKENPNLILRELENILTKDLGMKYDHANAEQKQELINIANKINAIK
jgi:hypothetical protein